MTETIILRVDVVDKKIFEEFSGMKFTAAMKLLMDNVKYGGKLGLDPFWSEENQTLLSKAIEDAKHGRNMHEHDLIEVEK
ncbi:MAG: hypothetical protein IJR52_08045 [Selenomonadaceae bacterium]|nr:hypothetical protein [Selenomonadaceae bacterium]MBQ9497505.1 hypothetical protein [Selenomonadaceae bacterium]